VANIAFQILANSFSLNSQDVMLVWVYFYIIIGAGQAFFAYEGD